MLEQVGVSVERRLPVPLRVLRRVGRENARRHGGYRGEVRRGRDAAARKVARCSIRLGHHAERLEIEGGQLVGDASVLELHLDQEIHLPLGLVEHVGQLGVFATGNETRRR
jgi:hypothetical protein